MKPLAEPPTRAAIEAAIAEVHARRKSDRGGKVADYIPELATVDANRFGIAVCTVKGDVIAVGDAAALQTIQSMAKPFVYGLALAEHGRDAVEAKVDIEPTGDAFNSIKLDPRGRPSNPMINAGAIAVAGLVPGEDDGDRVKRMLAMFSAYMGRGDVNIDAPVFLSEKKTGHRNRAIGYLLRHFGIIERDREHEGVVDLYFRECSVLASCRDLAVMAATIANRGANPLTGAPALPREHVEHLLTVMFTCGLYDYGGQFAVEVGLPAKSGVSGGILAVVPGVMGIGVVSPPLDEKGNSVRGIAVLRDLSDKLGLHVFRVAPPPPPPKAPSPEETLRADLWTRSDEKKKGDELPPEVRRIGDVVAAALAEFADEDGGKVASYIQDLADADPTKFAITVCTVDGHELAVGNAANHTFTIQSAANPFTFGTVLAAHGRAKVLEKVGVEPSVNPFHSVTLDPKNRPFNPMSNAGAITVASLVPGKDGPARLTHLLGRFSACAGEKVQINFPVFLQEQQAGDRNRAIASLLRNFGVVTDERGALELYLQSCSIDVTARTLARMGATLANGGINPITKEEALPRSVVTDVLTVMYTCGLHEDSGRFAADVGLPAKSGISGGIVAVAPGRFGIAVYSPPVDDHGNSFRGVLALHRIANALLVGVFDDPAGTA